MIAVGDFNVAHLDADIWNLNIASYIPTSAGTTPEERESFSKLMSDCKLADAFRSFYPTTTPTYPNPAGFISSGDVKNVNKDNVGFFTYWSQRAKNKQWNKGLRLDYTLVSKSMLDAGKVKEAFILTKYTAEFGDHCPIGLTVAV